MDLGGDVAGLEALSRAAGLETSNGTTYFVATNGAQVRAFDSAGADHDTEAGEALRLYRLDATDAIAQPVGQWYRKLFVGAVNPIRGLALVVFGGTALCFILLESGSILIYETNLVVGRFIDRGRLVGIDMGGNAAAAFAVGASIYAIIDSSSEQEKLYEITITAGTGNNTVDEIGGGLGVTLRQGFGATVHANTPYLLAAPGAEGPAVFDYPNVHLYTVDTTTGDLTLVGDTGIPYYARGVGLTSALLHRDGTEVGGMLRVWRQADTVLRVRPVTGAGPVRIEQVIGYK